MERIEYHNWLIENHPELFSKGIILLPGEKCQWGEQEFIGPCRLKKLSNGEIERSNLPEYHSVTA